MKTMNCLDDYLKIGRITFSLMIETDVKIIFPKSNKFWKYRNIPFLPLHTNVIMQVIPDNVTGYISVQQEMISTFYNMKVSNISTP